MRTGNEVVRDDALPVLQAARGLPGAKDGTGIGDLADGGTVDGWVREYLARRAECDASCVDAGFRFGVSAEGRYAGQSFVEAEPELRSEWSSGKNRGPWDTVRDAVWAGFDRARDRRV